MTERERLVAKRKAAKDAIDASIAAKRKAIDDYDTAWDDLVRADEALNHFDAQEKRAGDAKA